MSESTPPRLRDRSAAYGSLLNAPILPTLAALSVPNLLALGTQSLVAVAETTYIGILGTEPLAAMALVFPMFTCLCTASACRSDCCDLALTRLTDAVRMIEVVMMNISTASMVAPRVDGRAADDTARFLKPGVRCFIRRLSGARVHDEGNMGTVNMKEVRPAIWL